MLEDYRQLKIMEQKTLQIIQHVPEFAVYEELWNLAKGYRNINKINFYFQLTLDIKLRADKGKGKVNRHVYLGATATPIEKSNDLSDASYSVVICKDDDAKSKIVRKLHFDYESKVKRSDEPKPSLHIQMCGELAPYLADKGYSDKDIEHLEPGFEKPRIPTIPMCLALLIQWILLEFDTDENAKKILMNDTWKKHVIEVERELLKPFYKKCSEYFSARNDKKSFISEMMYEVMTG